MSTIAAMSSFVVPRPQGDLKAACPGCGAARSSCGAVHR